MTLNKMENYLRPRSIVIIGASQTKGSIGNITLQNLLDLDYQGKVYCVNPRYDQVEGIPCYPSAKDIPVEIDVAIIAVASQLVEAAIKDCAEKKITYALIFSGGFAETGEDGLQRQNKILEITKQSGMRIIGPNTMGSFNVKNRIPLSFSPQASTRWLAGNVGLVSQSGATGNTVMNKIVEEEIGISYTFTMGNQIDLTTLDIANVLINDEDTHIIASYMEAIPDGNQFKEVSKKALNEHKPFIVFKAGNSEAGKKAALSHTASLTGSKSSFDMVAKQYGVTVVNDIEEMIDALKAFNGRKQMKGERVATVVLSGAIGIMIADKLSEQGHQLVELSKKTKEQLREVVPEYLSIENPVDVASTIVTNPSIYKHCLETLVKAEEVDAVIMQVAMGGIGGDKLAQDIVEVSQRTDKPIIALTTGTEQGMGDIRKYLNKYNVPAYRSVKSTTKALDYLHIYEKAYENRHQLTSLISVQSDKVLRKKSETSITEPEVKRLLAESGIPIPKGGTGKFLNELIQIASELSYPLAAKIASPDITHKSDVGGVVLDIKNEEELSQAYKIIMSNINAHHATEQIDGILIEEMVEGPFLETIVGVKRDPVFGPIILCGLGGVYVEVMKDISQRLAPITEQTALEMIQELKSYPLFTGYRKGETYDVKAFAKVLSGISKLALSLGDQWSEIEINPLIIREESKGVMALDGLITLAEVDGTLVNN